MEYENYYKGSDKSAFLQKVSQIATLLGITDNDLMKVMYLESGLNPAAQNKSTKATGLIQFMPNTATSLGTTVDALKVMSGTEQLDYVYAYLKPFRGTMANYYDLYFAIFYPRAIGKPDTWLLQSDTLTAAKIAQYNKGYDLNSDNAITVGEVKTAIDSRLNLKKKIVVGSSITLIGVTIAVGVALMINSYYNNLE